MKWFDRPWATGQLDDSAWAQRTDQYARHLQQIQPRLAEGVKELASVIHLHDGQVAEWHYREREIRVLRVLVGDLQRGYE
jgi:hypothetical protein